MIALLYDIHGNDTALAAVIEDAKAAGADAWLLGGDYCLMGAQPAAVLDRLEGLPADTVWLRGNTERWVAHPEAEDIPIEAIRDAALFVQGAIGPDSVKELAALPDVLADVPFDGAGNDRLLPRLARLGHDRIHRPAGGHRRRRRRRASSRRNTIVCGHTHIQFAREVGVIEVVNPGSVGLPFDGDRRAAYALAGPRRLVRAASGSTTTSKPRWTRTATLEGDWVELARTRLLNAQN